MGSKSLIQSFEDLKKLPKRPPDEVHTTWAGVRDEDMYSLLRSVLGAVCDKPTIDGIEVRKYKEPPENLFRDVLHHMKDASLNLWGEELQVDEKVAPPAGRLPKSHRPRPVRAQVLGHRAAALSRAKSFWESSPLYRLTVLGRVA